MHPGYIDLLIQFDGNNLVTFPDKYVLPQDIRKALGAVDDLIIHANTPYPLKYENGEYIISFPF